MGNGDRWTGEISEMLAVVKRQAERLGIILLDVNAVELGGVCFLGGMLWVDGRLSGIDMRPEASTGDAIDVAHTGGARQMTADGKTGESCASHAIE
jgi:hypothetical protein